MEKALEFKRKVYNVNAIQFDGENYEAIKNFAAENGGTTELHEKSQWYPKRFILVALGESSRIEDDDWVIWDPWDGFRVLDTDGFARMYEGI